MKRDAWALLVISTCAAAFFFRLFWPTPLLLVTPDFGRSDAWHFTFVTKFLLGKNLTGGALPIWIPELGRGFPLMAEGQTGTFYIPNVLLYRFLDSVTAYNASILLTILFLGWGMYMWVRRMNWSRIAGLFAALSLMFSGMTLSQLPHGALLQGISLLPWVLYLTLRLFQTKSRSAIAIWAFIYSQQLLTGFPQAAFITILFSFAYGAWLLQESSTKTMDSIRFLLACAASLGLSAVQILPSWEFLNQTTVAGGMTSDVSTYFSYPIKHLATLLEPFFLGNPKFGTYPPFFAFDGSIFWENVGGIGWIPVSLAIITMMKFRSKNIAFFALSVPISLLLMLGKYSPLYLVYSFWPFHLFRVPSRFIWIFVLSIIMIASYAIHRIWRNGRIQKIGVLAAITLHTAILTNTWFSYQAFEPAHLWLTPPEAISRLPNDPNIFTVGSEPIHNQSFLTNGWKSMKPYTSLRNSLAPNSSSIWGITSANVYAGRFLRRPSILAEFIDHEFPVDSREATLSAVGKKLLTISGITSVIAAVTITQSEPPYLEKITTHDTLTLWNNPEAVPRAYLADQVHVATTKEKAFGILRHEDFIPGKSVLLEDPIHVGQTTDKPTGTAQITDRSNTTLTISVKDNNRDTVLIVTDTYYPGWKAILDGFEVPIFPANIRQRGVIVPPGNHTIQMRYEPKSLFLGFAISVVTLLLLVILMVFLPSSSDPHTLATDASPGPHRPHSRAS